MTLSETVHLATRTLRRNALRSALTLVGITIGVGAVVTMVAVGNGARASIEDQVVAAGMNVITVVAGNYKMKGEDGGGGVVDHNASLETGKKGSGARPLFVRHPEDDPMEKHDHPTARQRLGDSAAGLGAAATLTRADADAIRQGVSGIQYVSAGVHESARVLYGDRRWFTRLHGGETDLQRIRRSWTFKYGRFFSDREFNNTALVTVLGTVAHEKLFGRETDPTGREVRIWNQPFTVVGVIASTNWATTGAVGDDQFDAVYVPLTTVHRLLNLSKLNSITVTSRSAGETTKVSRAITELLRKRHGIGEAAPDDFVVQTQASLALGKGVSPQVARAITGNAPGLEQLTLEQLSHTLERASRTMTVLLASVAGVSLLVGGIGIMNIMLLSVTERTKEIGLRMALGARSRDVMLQFLTEAVTLSLIGGVIGVLLALAASGGVKQVLRWSAVVSPEAVVLAVVVAAAVGVFFGIYPARQAAQLDPIDALRYE
ncbi:MAG: ABC transporter permease [Vicinamibacterales bacterium]|nr:ABC transporter permease [Vicinamibacterales bacterium]